MAGGENSVFVNRQCRHNRVDYLRNESNIVDVLRRSRTATHATVPCQQLLTAGLCICAVGIDHDELIRVSKSIESAIGFELFCMAESTMKCNK